MTLSNRQGPVRPAAEHLIHLALRRALLAASENSSDRQARLDCAELALTLDLRDEARLLFETAFIAGGYDSEALNAQENLRRETQLWEAAELRVGNVAQQFRPLQSRIDGAVANLAECMTLAVENPTPPTAVDQGLRSLGHEADLAVSARDFARHVHAMHRALQAPFASSALADAIQTLVSDPLIRSSLTARDRVDAPIATLIGLVAAEAMRRFLRQRHILLTGPLASPALTHKSAGFDRAGLGPWLGNAMRLVQDSRGLISLAEAAMAGDSSPSAVQRGVALLSAGLEPDELANVIDMLPDEGLLECLYLISYGYRTDLAWSDRSILLRLRDAAINLDAPNLAIEMQTHLVQLSPFSSVESDIIAALQTKKIVKGCASTMGEGENR